VSTPIEPFALSPKDAAAYGGLGLTTIKALLRSGALPHTARPESARSFCEVSRCAIQKPAHESPFSKIRQYCLGRN